ncbi:MAG TPA: hypothetical protein VGI70_17295 [Polyangiales bacterium]
MNSFAVRGPIVSTLAALLACSPVDIVAVPLPSGAIGDAGAPVCAYGPAADGGESGVGFERALCTCDAFSSDSDLHVDGFDRRRGPYRPDAGDGAVPASVGVNREIGLSGSGTITGDLVAADGGISLGPGDLDVGGKLAVGGPLEGASSAIHVAGDAEVSGRIEVSSLAIGGTLTQPDGASLDVSGDARYGAMRSADVLVDPPCSCDDGALFDVSARVQARASSATSLAANATIAGDACREYVLAAHTLDSLHIQAERSAAIYVPGSLHVMNDFVLESAPGVQVDFFIEDELSVDGQIQIGDDSDATRLYVGGAGTFPIMGGGQIHAAVYAPRAELVLSAELDVFGALFLRRVAATAPLVVHYDAQVAAAR